MSLSLLDYGVFWEIYNRRQTMKKKITHSVLFVAVLAGTTGLTLFAGRGNLSSTIYNFVFLAVIAVLYMIANVRRNSSV